MLDDLKQAYETLGLPENADREQVENRYFLLMKKARARQQRSSDAASSDEGLEIETINRAYNRILGHESDKEATEPKQSKSAYFFYYYKFHVLITIVALILIVFTVKGVVDRRNEEASKPPLDLAVTVFGNFFTTDAPRLSQNLNAQAPEWKRIDVNLVTIPKEMQTQQDMALQQKGMLTLMTEKMDLLILDERNFQELAKQGVFMPLDDFKQWPGMQKNPNRIRTALANEETSAHAYGIDITGSSVFGGTQIAQLGEKQIVAVRAEPAHKDKALRMLQALTLLE
jgi:hypothetical protein